MIEELKDLTDELAGRLHSGEISQEAHDVSYEYMSRAFDIILDGMPHEMFQFMEGT